jgi:hypothetical protein
LIGGNKMDNWVNNSLKTFTSATASDNENKENLGLPGAGITREYGNGKAHSEKTTTFNGQIDTF